MIQLTMKDQEINDVLVKLIAGEIKIKAAMMVMDLSKRQVLRKKAAYLKKGISSVPHQSRGRSTNRGYSQELTEEIITLYKTEYNDWNFHHFNDVLETSHQIKVSDSFVYKLLISSGIESPKKYKKRRKSHPPRERKENAGELIQCDASKHTWFEGDDTHYYLHGAIDDATNIVTGVYLAEQETILGYQNVLYQTVKDYGIPESLYTDYRTIFQSPKKELSIDEKLAGKEIENTRFVKMIKKLGIDISSTESPQAKGRIERLWKTFQDRLYNELKKRNINTIKEANKYLIDEFLPNHNRLFASAIDSNRNLFVSVDSDFDFNTKLAVWEERKVYNHCYLKIKNKNYVIYDNDKPAYFMTRNNLEVFTFLDGSVNVWYKDKFYKTLVVDNVIEKQKPLTPLKTAAEISASKVRTPAPDHPWKKSQLTKNWDLYKSHSNSPR